MRRLLRTVDIVSREVRMVNVVRREVTPLHHFGLILLVDLGALWWRLLLKLVL